MSLTYVEKASLIIILTVCSAILSPCSSLFFTDPITFYVLTFFLNSVYYPPPRLEYKHPNDRGFSISFAAVSLVLIIVSGK